MLPRSPRDGRALGGLLALALAACAGCNASPIAEAAERSAAPFEETFASFDAWARRTMDAHAAWRNQSAMSETLWAPIRNERAIADARVRVTPSEPLQLREAEGWPGPTGWFELRHATLDRLRVQEATMALGDDERRVVVLSRGPQAEEPLGIEVEVAFDLDAP